MQYRAASSIVSMLWGCMDSISYGLNQVPHCLLHTPQIISDIKSMRVDRRGQPLEAALTGGMGHMGVLRTLTWAFSQASNKARRSSAGGNIITSSGSNSRRNSEGGVASLKHEGYLVSGSHMNALTRLGRAAGGTRSEAGVTSDSDDTSRVSPAGRCRSEGGAAAGSTHGKPPASHRARSEGGGGAESDGGSSSGITERGVAEIFCGGGAASANCWMVMEYCDMGCVAVSGHAKGANQHVSCGRGCTDVALRPFCLWHACMSMQ